ncbi:hypothetical protein [Methylobacterium sp. SI9]|uniref:hypothetical protein n=1 Tax=Methylobacterium guangdongense TaxID=3138811 RepID=UPI00313EDEF8
MADDKMNLEIGVDVRVTDLAQAKALREEFERLNAEILKFGRDLKAAANPMSSLGRARSQLSAGAARGGNAALDAEKMTFSELRRRFAFEKRMQAQKAREESTAAKRVKEEQAETRRALNDQLTFSMRMMRERARAEAEAERTARREIEATAKARDKANRKAISDAKELSRAQGKAAERAARGAGQIRSGVGRVAGTAAATGAAAGYGLERAVDRGVSTRMDVDSAETALKIFGDMPDGKGGKRAITAADIRSLRRGPNGLDNLAVRTGTSVPDALRAFTEASKAGLMSPAEQAANILTAGNGLELDPTKTTRLLGTMARNMGAAATPARLKKTLNAVAIGAREDPTQSNEIIEGLSRAQGVLAMSSGITEEDLVALVSGGQSVGIQPGKAGTAITALARSILEGGNKFIDPKKRKELNFASRKLGFGSARDMAGKFAGKDGKSVLYQIFGNLRTMPAQLRQQVADALSGGQWADEDLQIVNGIDGMRSTDAAIQDPKNAGFLDEANAKKMQSWQGLWNQSKTIFSLFWESFGAGFDGILRDVNAFVLGLHGKMDYDRISGYVREALDGLRQGLGFDSWREALQSLVPTNAKDLGKKIGQFARGFGSAIRQIAGAVASVAGMFGGGGGAESMGKLTAQFLALGIACVALAPVMGVLGGLASIVLGLANVTRAATSVLGLGAGAAAGGLGGGAVAGALAGVARILSGGFVIGLAASIGAMRGEIATMVLSAVRPLVAAVWSGLKQAFSLEGLKAGGKAIIGELIPAPLQRWLDSGTPDQSKADSPRWVDPPSRDAETPRKLTQAIKDNTAALQGKTRAGAGTTASAGAISFDDWQRQIAGMRGEQVGAQVNRGIRGHVARLRGGAEGQNDGDPDQKSGGSRSWRNNNPGNLEYGNFAKSMGAIGSDGRFAKFKSYEDGRKAQEKLLFESKGYKDLTLGQAIRRWAPGSENNVPAYVAAMGGDDPSKRMSQYTPEQRGRLLDAMQAHEGWRTGTIAGGNVAASMPGGNPVDVASRFIGMGETNNRAAVEGFVGHGIRGAAQAWCSRFVNASLAAVGQTGTGSAVANSFLHWGKAITADMVQKGDVLVEHRGKGDNGLGGHVGFSTGRTRTGRDGQLELEMLAGNTNDEVAVSWEKASTLAIRRSNQISERVAADTKRTQSLGSSAMKPNLGNLDVTPRAELGSKASLGQDTPLRQAPVGSGGGGQGGGGNTTTNHININGHNKSPKELASEVQRAVQDDMNRRVHDFDGFA